MHRLLLFTVMASWPASGYVDLSSAMALHQEGLADLEAGRAKAAESKLREAIRCYRVGGAAPELRVAAMSQLGTLLVRQRRMSEAETLIYEALEIGDALPRNDPWKAAVTRLLGVVHVWAGDLTRAGQDLEEAVWALENSNAWRVDVAVARLDLCELRSIQRRHAEAVALCARSVAEIEAVSGPDHPQTAAALHKLGLAQMARSPAEAERTLREALARFRSAQPQTAAVSRSIGRVLLAQGDAAQALEWNSRSLDWARSAEDQDLTAELLQDRSAVLKALGRKKDSAQCAREAARLMASIRDAGVPSNSTVHVNALRR